MGDGGILLAGGAGRRMDNGAKEKILLPINGKPVFQYSLEAFSASGLFDEIVIVYREDLQKNALEKVTESMDMDEMPDLNWVQGGKERMHSVWNGLQKFEAQPELVFIHDCARPAIGNKLLIQLATAARKHGAASAAHRIADTIKRVAAEETYDQTHQLEDIQRKYLWGMETPQVFRYSEICKGYKIAMDKQIQVTDDTAALSLAGQKVSLVESRLPNPQLTTSRDLPFLEFLLMENPPCE